MSEQVPARLISVEETSKVLGVGRTQVFELLRAREIDSVKIRNRRLIPVVAIDEYVARLREGSERQS
jgi:excisionase family DNA binding protein|tara:strand:+ start:1448 stop:1648 length:201 start_codon:yes stop_codon:yes gene_type:complete